MGAEAHGPRPREQKTAPRTHNDCGYTVYVHGCPLHLATTATQGSLVRGSPVFDSLLVYKKARTSALHQQAGGKYLPSKYNWARNFAGRVSMTPKTITSRKSVFFAALHEALVNLFFFSVIWLCLMLRSCISTCMFVLSPRVEHPRRVVCENHAFLVFEKGIPLLNRFSQEYCQPL